MKNKSPLWNYTSGYRGLYVGAILSIGLASFFALLQPQIIRITIDGLLGEKRTGEWFERLIVGGGGEPASLLIRAALLFISFSLLDGVFQFFKGRLSGVASDSIVKQLRDQIYRHLQYLPFSYHAGVNRGDLMQRCTSDIDTIHNFLGTQVTEVGRGIFLAGMTLLFMIVLDPWMTLVATAAIPLIILFSFIFFKKIELIFTDVEKAESRLIDRLQSNLTGIRVVRAFARQPYEIETFDKKNRAFRDKAMRLIRLLALYWAFSDIVCLFQIAVVAIVGSVRVIEGSITLGVMLSFFIYVTQLLWPIREMGRILSEMGKASIASGRIEEILSQPKEEDGGEERPSISGKIEFKNVSFQYTPYLPVLKNVSFTIEQGETVAIVGPTGCGKSSLVQLIPKLYDATEGEILIDNTPLSQIDKEWLRKHVGIILQETFLYNRTVKENLAISFPDITDDRVYHVAQQAMLHKVIGEFDQGYDTMVGEGGVTLSGGQKQRMALARILLRESPILIMDDSLSAVDTETDAQIRDALKKRERKTTTIIIAHRITSVQEADKIIVLQEGRVIQQGKHNELIRVEGPYKRNWEIHTAESELH